MKIAFAVAVSALSFVVVGCSGTSQDDTSTSSTTAEDLSVATMSGTYSIKSAANVAEFNSVVINKNHTFHGQGGCRPNPKGPSCFAITSITGTWATKTQNGAKVITFTDSFKQEKSYFYSMANDELELGLTASSKKSTFDKDLSKLPKLKFYDTCADKDGNTVGNCPESDPCEYDGPSGNVQRCLPPI